MRTTVQAVRPESHAHFYFHAPTCEHAEVNFLLFLYFCTQYPDLLGKYSSSNTPFYSNNNPKEHTALTITKPGALYDKHHWNHFGEQTHLVLSGQYAGAILAPPQHERTPSNTLRIRRFIATHRPVEQTLVRKIAKRDTMPGLATSLQTFLTQSGGFIHALTNLLSNTRLPVDTRQIHFNYTTFDTYLKTLAQM